MGVMLSGVCQGSIFTDFQSRPYSSQEVVSGVVGALTAGGKGETFRCETVLFLDLAGGIPEVCLCKNSWSSGSYTQGLYFMIYKLTLDF